MRRCLSQLVGRWGTTMNEELETVEERQERLDYERRHAETMRRLLAEEAAFFYVPPPMPEVEEEEEEEGSE